MLTLSCQTKLGCGVGSEPSSPSTLERESALPVTLPWIPADDDPVRAADSRIYEYLLPSYCLIPPHKDDPLAKHLDISSPDWRDIVGEGPCSFADARLPMPTSDEGEVDPKVRGEYERKRRWRVDEKTLNRFRDIIAQYKGTQ